MPSHDKACHPGDKGVSKMSQNSIVADKVELQTLYLKNGT